MLLAVNGFEAFSSELAQAVELQLMGFRASLTKKSSRLALKVRGQKGFCFCLR